MTKQEIGAALQLSMPTTLQNVNDMLERGILEEGGATESTGGRRARKIQLNRKAGYCAGIDITTDSMEMVAANLMGEVIGKQSRPLKFRDEPEVYDQIGETFEAFLKKNRLKSKILGVGISFPGIIDVQADRIIRSHIFGLEYVSLDRFRKSIPYPLIVENDANCLGYAEVSGSRMDYIYISLNKTVGGALVQEDGQIVKGEGFRAGEIGHLILVPGGRKCYCGKSGCVDAYLSSGILSGEEQSLEKFFDALQRNDRNAFSKWEKYLDDLAILTTNLRMVLDQKIMIGGEVGAYIEPYMGELQKRAAEYDRFARDVDYLYPCTQTEAAGALGAALLALDEFGNEVLK